MIKVGDRIEVSRSTVEQDPFVMYGDVLDMEVGEQTTTLTLKLYPRSGETPSACVEVPNFVIYGPAPVDDVVRLEQWLDT